MNLKDPTYENTSCLLSSDAEEVRKRAYEIYLLRCNSDIWEYGVLGNSVGDWVQAENEVNEGTADPLRSGLGNG